MSHASAEARAARLRRFGGPSGGSASAALEGARPCGGAAAAAAGCAAPPPCAAETATPSLPSRTARRVPAGPSGSARLGLIADVQYADADDAFDFTGRHKRHYRNTLSVLEEAVRVWNAVPVSAVVQLGDLIDGCSARSGASAAALGTVLRTLAGSTATRFDLIGNHDLYNFPRSALPGSGLQCPAAGALGGAHSTAALGDFWQLVFLDSYEHALVGVPESHPSFAEAASILRAHNERALHAADWAAEAPPGKERYTPLNGAVSPAQLAWLRGVLAAAKEEGRSVLVFSHVPVYEPASGPKTVVWNGDEVLEVLHEFCDSVVAVFAGHDHCGGYAVDAAGLHHVTLCSPLHVAPPGRECFGVLECHEAGWAHLTCFGYACAESGKEWQGRPYPELILAKGADNRPV